MTPSLHTLKVLTRVARRYSVVEYEADDLVQEVLLSAIEKKRDFNDPGFVAWATGAIRNGARFAARSAARRMRRERSYALDFVPQSSSRASLPEVFVAALPPSRRIVARLANLGLSRAEIAYLLRLSDIALRKRVSGIRIAFAEFSGELEIDELDPSRVDGLARRALKESLPRHVRPIFAVRDPDGIPVFFAGKRSRK